MSVPEEKNLSSICRTVNTCDHCNVDTNCDDQTMFPIYSCFDDANLKRWCDGASITNDIVLHREQSRAKMVATDAQVQPAAQSSMLTPAVEPAEPAVSVDAVSVVHEFHGDGDYILLQRGMVATSKACELASGDSQLSGHMAGAGGADNASKHASPRTQKLASTAHWLSNWYGTGTDEHAHDTPRAATTRLRRTCNIKDCLPSVDKLGKGSYSAVFKVTMDHAAPAATEDSGEPGARRRALALKVPLTNNAAEGFTRAELRELLILQRLHGFNVSPTVRCAVVTQAKGTHTTCSPFIGIVMDAGVSLWSVVQTLPDVVKDVEHVIYHQMVRLVLQCFVLGVAHRDINPWNMLLLQHPHDKQDMATSTTAWPPDVPVQLRLIDFGGSQALLPECYTMQAAAEMIQGARAAAAGVASNELEALDAPTPAAHAHPHILRRVMERCESNATTRTVATLISRPPEMFSFDGLGAAVEMTSEDGRPIEIELGTTVGSSSLDSDASPTRPSAIPAVRGLFMPDIATAIMKGDIWSVASTILDIFCRIREMRSPLTHALYSDVEQCAYIQELYGVSSTAMQDLQRNGYRLREQGWALRARAPVDIPEFQSCFKHMPPELASLLNIMLAYDPDARCMPHDIAAHAYMADYLHSFPLMENDVGEAGKADKHHRPATDTEWTCPGFGVFVNADGRHYTTEDKRLDVPLATNGDAATTASDAWWRFAMDSMATLLLPGMHDIERGAGDDRRKQTLMVTPKSPTVYAAACEILRNVSKHPGVTPSPAYCFAAIQLAVKCIGSFNESSVCIQRSIERYVTNAGNLCAEPCPESCLPDQAKGRRSVKRCRDNCRDKPDGETLTHDAVYADDHDSAVTSDDDDLHRICAVFIHRNDNGRACKQSILPATQHASQTLSYADVTSAECHILQLLSASLWTCMYNTAEGLAWATAYIRVSKSAPSSYRTSAHIRPLATRCVLTRASNAIAACSIARNVVPSFAGAGVTEQAYRRDCQRIVQAVLDDERCIMTALTADWAYGSWIPAILSPSTTKTETMLAQSESPSADDAVSACEHGALDSVTPSKDNVSQPKMAVAAFLACQSPSSALLCESACASGGAGDATKSPGAKTGHTDERLIVSWRPSACMHCQSAHVIADLTSVLPDTMHDVFCRL
jgi:serine/threonine protein kinase